MINVPLRNLIPGGDINSRVGETDVGSLANSIKELGLILPLAVMPESPGGEIYRVVDGNRRLLALRLVYSDEPDAMIPVSVSEPDGDIDRAIAQSLAANIERLPLHPVDQYEAFAKMANGGDSIETVATWFGISTRGVRQRMALGSLAPEIRQAYRDGELSDRAVKMMTRVDKETQVRVFNENKGSAWKIEQALTALTEGKDYNPRTALCKFVGLDAYLANGGQRRADLFVDEDQQMWTDTELVMKLANEKVIRLKREVLDAGWQFCIQAEDNMWSTYTFEQAHVEPYTEAEESEIESLRRSIDEIQIRIEAVDEDDELALDELYGEEERLRDALNAIEEREGEWSDDQKARLGVIISTNWEVIYGARRRDGMGAPIDGEGEGEYPDAKGSEPAEKPISSALMMDLNGHLTNAVRDALTDSPEVALRLLVLKLIKRHYIDPHTPPIGIELNFQSVVPVSEYGEKPLVEKMWKKLAKAKDLAAEIKLLNKVPTSDIIHILAFFVGRSVAMLRKEEQLVQLVNDSGHLNIPRSYKPSAEDYFERLNLKQLEKLAKGEGWGTTEGMKKKEAVAFCIRMVGTNLGWICPEMRVPSVEQKPKGKAGGKPDQEDDD